MLLGIQEGYFNMGDVSTCQYAGMILLEARGDGAKEKTTAETQSSGW